MYGGIKCIVIVYFFTNFHRDIFIGLPCTYSRAAKIQKIQQFEFIFITLEIVLLEKELVILNNTQIKTVF